MGAFWLHWLPDYLSSGGVRFRLEDGWKTRSRSSGGFDSILGVQAHQTVSNTAVSNDIRYCWYNASTRPIGNLILDRTGLVHVGAAGASNTAGKGGPRYTSRGTVPLDSGNRYLVAIEACNDGYGEVWPDVQCGAYVDLVTSIIRGINAETPGAPLGAGDVHGHFEWAPTRKVDPRGPSRWSKGATEKFWMDAFRGDVFQALNPPPPPTPPAPAPSKWTISATGLFRLSPGDSPWRVAEVVYGDGRRHTEITAANPGAKWVPGEQLWIPNTAGVLGKVEQGDSWWSMLREVWPMDSPSLRDATVQRWGGVPGGYVLKAGDFVFLLNEKRG